MQAGGNINSGGGVNSGGGLVQDAQGLAKQVAGRFSRAVDGRHPSLNPELMYGHLLKMAPHEWEVMRHVAGELLGAGAHPFMGAMNLKNRVLQAGKEHYQHITNLASPVMAGRMLLHDQGGGFFDSLKHVFNESVNNVSKVGAWFDSASPYVATGLAVAEHIPSFQPYVADARNLHGTAMDINEKAQAGVNLVQSARDADFDGALNNYATLTKGTSYGISGWD